MDIILLTRLGLSTRVIGLREGIEGLEILDVCGHKIDGESLRMVWWCFEGVCESGDL